MIFKETNRKFSKLFISPPKSDLTKKFSNKFFNNNIEELKSFDVGYKFTADNGKSYPFRSKGLQIPTFAEFIEEFHMHNLNIEINNLEILFKKFE